MVDEAAPPAPAAEPGLIRVRATVHLPGLPVGEQAWVDPSVPYIAAALAGQQLVPMPEA